MRFPEVFAAELEEVPRRRESLASRRRWVKLEVPRDAPEAAEPLVGLALSGGGLRASAFHLGVVQGLQQSGAFDAVDYLSTVGGGSFLGAGIHTAMRTGDELPSETDAGEATFVTWLRHHSDLAPGGFRETIRAFTAALRAIFLCYLALVPLLLLLAVALDLVYGGEPGVSVKGILTQWEKQQEGLEELEARRQSGEVLSFREEHPRISGTRFRKSFQLSPWILLLIAILIVVQPLIRRHFRLAQRGADGESGLDSLWLAQQNAFALNHGRYDADLEILSRVVDQGLRHG